jgi:hypothetical protein
MDARRARWLGATAAHVLEPRAVGDRSRDAGVGQPGRHQPSGLGHSLVEVTHTSLALLQQRRHRRTSPTPPTQQNALTFSNTTTPAKNRLNLGSQAFRYGVFPATRVDDNVNFKTIHLPTGRMSHPCYFSFPNMRSSATRRIFL